MTDLITLDPNDTGEIPGGEGSNLELTTRLTLADQTEKILLGHHAALLPLVIDVRPPSPDTHGPSVLYRPASLADTVFALDPGRPNPDPVPPPPPPAPTSHAWVGRAGEFPVVVPDGPRPGRGRHRVPAPRWVFAVLWMALGVVLGGAAFGAGMAWLVTR